MVRHWSVTAIRNFTKEAERELGVEGYIKGGGNPHRLILALTLFRKWRHDDGGPQAR